MHMPTGKAKAVRAALQSIYDNFLRRIRAALQSIYDKPLRRIRAVKHTPSAVLQE